MKALFFSPDFSEDFDWRERYLLRIGSVRPENKEQISNGLRDMSSESIRNRFLGSKKAFSELELKYLTTLDGFNHYAFGVEERLGNKRGIAVVRLVRSSDVPSEAEVAITIIDDYQRLGLGEFLLSMIVLAAFERHIERLSFTFLPQNDAIVRLIQRIAEPVQGPYNRDYIQYYLEMKNIDINRIKARLKSTLPVIDTFPSKI